MRFHIAAALSIAALMAAPTIAAAPAKTAEVCPAKPVLPPELADWSRNVSSKTIYGYGEPRDIGWPALGAARTELSLHKTESLRYWIAPEREPDVFKFGGMVPIDVKKAGRLVVALDGGAWIDLVHEGAVVKSATHGHGPACSGIRKMVEFDVTPGRYLLQIVNAPSDKIRAMAVMR
ncbi:homogentisate 1,2-dioxygenase [Sphingopyxis sp.]|uniref:homogentisate 1,2-dioxygenase n=1 Tax=Sphingopyxis sp. TaxID=1908224 RepID=UPI003BA9DD27